MEYNSSDQEVDPEWVGGGEGGREFKSKGELVSLVTALLGKQIPKVSQLASLKSSSHRNILLMFQHLSCKAVCEQPRA